MASEQEFGHRRTFFQRIAGYYFSGTIIGLSYGVIEYYATLGTAEEQSFWPLTLRATLAGFFIGFSAGSFEIISRKWLLQRSFLFLITVRTLVYVAIITFWLGLLNGLSSALLGITGFWQGTLVYLNSEGYLVNIVTVTVIIAVAVVSHQFNRLHKKDELLNFILGRFREPREVERIFCFLDLENSTQIAESMGHQKFGRFLQDYFADITPALRKCRTEIYQYAGDEVILMWPMEKGLSRANALKLPFEVKRVLGLQADKYLKKYGVLPGFKAGIHGGKVLVTWVGEMKKEIVYIGDVLNTAARIRSECTTHREMVIVSKELFDRFGATPGLQANALGPTSMKGKSDDVFLYGMTEVANPSA